MEDSWWLQPSAGMLVAVVLAFVGAYLLFHLRMRSHYPPGPSAWPLVGNLPSFLHQKDMVAYFDKVADDYGPVTTLWLGTQPAVMLNSLEAVREAYINKAELFGERPFPYAIQRVFDGKRTGIMMTSGDANRAMRRFTLMALHDFGLGKQSLEEKIQEEALVVVDELQKTKGQPIRDIRRIIKLAISNVMISIVFGHRFPYNDEEFSSLIKNIDYFFENNPLFLPESLVIVLRYLPISTVLDKTIAAQDKVKDYVRKQIESHRVTFDPNNVRDFVDLYLKADAEKDEYFSADNLFRTILDLFFAGTETTATTISWILLYLIKNPCIQKKAQTEINMVIGRHKLPSAKDRERLPYLDAVVHEVFRMASVASLGIPRCASETTTIQGHKIPKNSTIFPNIHRIHMDKTYWKDPEVFRPERWLDESGSLVKHGHYLPFSIGKRSCLGETFAKTETFIVLTMLLQRFEFRLPPIGVEPSYEGTFGLTRSPVDYDICAVAVM